MTKEVRYEGGVLYCQNTLDDEELNETSQFLIGSVTKIFTYILILILQQEKKLNIEDEISIYLDDFEGFSIKDLMEHKTNLINIPTNYVQKSNKRYRTVTSVIDTFINTDLKDKEKQYSNTGYLILGAMIEKVTKQPFIKALKEYILEPLNMTNTDIGVNDITCYHNGNRLTKREINMRYYASSAGGLYSCASDLKKFSKFFKLLTRESIDILMSGNLHRENPERIYHNGGIFGGTSKYAIYLDKDELLIKLSAVSNF